MKNEMQNLITLSLYRFSNNILLVEIEFHSSIIFIFLNQMSDLSFLKFSIILIMLLKSNFNKNYTFHCNDHFQLDKPEFFLLIIIHKMIFFNMHNTLKFN